MQFNLHLIEEILAVVEEVDFALNCTHYSTSINTKTK
jgi:hypothetical protein